MKANLMDNWEDSYLLKSSMGKLLEKFTKERPCSCFGAGWAVIRLEKE